MASVNEATEIFRRDARSKGKTLTPAQREELARRFLPKPDKASNTNEPRKKQKRVRSFIRSQIHLLLYNLIHLVVSVVIRFKQFYNALLDRLLAITYYHHRTPELIRKDVRNLKRVPQHLSIILHLKGDDGGLEGLMDEVAELAAWATCVGVPLLSIYEKTGVLKSYIPSLHSLVMSKLSSYFGPPPHLPRLRLLAPHNAPYSPSVSPTPEANGEEQSADAPPAPSLDLLLLSATDGRATLVDLTKTLAEMAQRGKLSPHDISLELVDAELSELTTPPSPLPVSTWEAYGTPQPTSTGSDISDPDLLIIFGSAVVLDSYPPWQLRLTEIFCTGDKGRDGSETVEYQGFLRALWKYARAEMRFGR